jgi:dynamin 1-like protein
VKQVIEHETNQVAGYGKQVSEVPICVDIHSPRVVNLTLVDLPGLTKNPVVDQPKEIEQMIRSIIIPFASNPNSIIVAVSPANADIATSDALSMARDLDPEGERTIGVLTKLDLVDRGTDCAAVLQGKVIPLKYGYVGVVCRSQHDINVGKSIYDAVKAEQKFIRDHEVYRSMAHRLGTVFLARRMNKILIHHIQKCLPGLRKRIGKLKAETRSELHSLGVSESYSDAHKDHRLNTILRGFAKSFRDVLEGHTAHENEAKGGNAGNHMIREILEVQLPNWLNGVDAFANLSDQQIRTAIRNAIATQPSLFTAAPAFELLVTKQIRRLQHRCLQCSEVVFEEMQRVTKQACSGVANLSRYPALKQRIEDCSRELLHERLEQTKISIEDLVSFHCAYINLNSPGNDTADQVERFLRSDSRSGAGSSSSRSGRRRGRANTSRSSATAAASDLASATIAGVHAAASLISDLKNDGGPPPIDSDDELGRYDGSKDEIVSLPSIPDILTAQEHKRTGGARVTNLNKALISNYFASTRKHICNFVPKIIMHDLLDMFLDRLPVKLDRDLLKPELIDELLVEDEQIALRRTELLQLQSQLFEAERVMATLKNIDIRE